MLSVLTATKSIAYILCMLAIGAAGSVLGDIGLVINDTGLVINDTKANTGDIAGKKGEIGDAVQDIGIASGQIKNLIDFDATEKLFDDLAGEVNNVLFVDVDASKFTDIIKNRITDEIDQHVDDQAAGIESKMAGLADGTKEFIMIAEKYDPYAEYDPLPVAQAFSKIYENIITVESGTNETIYGYGSFLYEATRRFDDVNRMLEESILDAYIHSGNNLGSLLDKLKEARNQIHGLNAEILGSFSAKLGYTRLGTVVNNQVYDFIVKPVNMVQTTATSNRLFGRGVESRGDRLLVAAVTVIVLYGAILLVKVILGGQIPFIISKERNVFQK